MRLVFLLVLAAGSALAQSKHVVVIAHRGEHLSHPENTIEAFQASVDAGADFFELDVRTTRDGKLILMHDTSVSRTTGGTGQIADMTFEEIRKLKVHGAQIPTLDEALEFAHSKIGVYIDSKAVSAGDAVAAIERHQMQDHVVIYGGPDYLKQVTTLRPQLRVMPEAGDPARLQTLMEALHLKVAAFDAKDFIEETLAVARAAKLDIYVDRLGLADHPKAWQDAIDRGATGIQTDHPAELVAYLKSHGYR